MLSLPRLAGSDFSQAGRPLLHSGEVNLAQFDRVQFECDNPCSLQGDAEARAEWKDGLVLLSSHRLLWYEPLRQGGCRGFFLPLPAIASVAKKAPLFKTPRILVDLRTDYETNVPSVGLRATQLQQVKFVLRANDAEPDKLHSALKAALKAHAWESNPLPSSTSTQSPAPAPSFVPWARGAPPPSDSPSPSPSPSAASTASAPALPTPAPPHYLPEEFRNPFYPGPGVPTAKPLGPSMSTPAMSALSLGSPPPPAALHPTHHSAVAGIAGLKRQQDEFAQSAMSTLSRGFQDLEHLMARAGDLVSLAQFIRGTLDKIAVDSAERREGEGEVNSVLVDLGILNPTTKEAAGKLFHKELAKELGDFLLSPRPGRPPLLDEHRGMVLLSDCYCLFNRARGTALVSPEDLIRACQILTDLKLGLGLKTFPSGVAVLQADRWSEEAVCVQLQQLLIKSPRDEPTEDGPDASSSQPLTPEDVQWSSRGLTAVDAAKQMGLPVLVAREFLEMAEKRGVLCRDESLEGIRFFRNCFALPV